MLKFIYEIVLNKRGLKDMKTKCLKSLKLSIVLFALLFFLHTVVFMTKNMFSAAMASIVEEGVMTKTETGTITAIFWLVYAVFQFVGGFAADRYSSFWLITIGIISGIISNFLIYFNQSYQFVIIVWCINAALQFGLWPGIFKMISTQIRFEFRETALFWILLSTSIGQAISMIVASFVNSWQNNFLISAIALIVLLVIWCVIYKLLEKNMEETEIAKKSVKIEPKLSMSTKDFLLKSGLPVIFLICFLVNMVANGMKTIPPVMLMESYATLPASLATRLSVVLIFFAVLGMFIANFVRHKITKHEMKGASLLLCISVPTLLLSSLIGKIHYAAILAFLSFSIIFIQGALPLANTFSSARFIPYGRGATVSGILNAALAMGNVASAYVFPRIGETLPWYTVTAVWAFSILLSALVAFIMIKFWTSFIKKEKIKAK